jgi:DNA-binding NarL/FixJ family response regulator
VQRRASILIADDHALVSLGLRELLRGTFTVVGVVGDGREVHDAVERTRPDVLLLDLSMPHRNGLDLIPELVEAFPELRILVVTMHVDRALADLALKSGAHGFVPKGSSADELTYAIGQVLGGARYISPKIPRRSFRDGAALEDPALDRLTPRQRRVLELIGQGKTSAEIAEALNLGVRTIEFHRGQIRKVLGVSSEKGLIRYAIMLSVRGAGGGAEAPEAEEAGRGEV